MFMSQKLRFGAIVFLLSLIFVIGMGIFFQRRDAIYLAIVDPTGSDNTSGIEMIQGVQLYLNRAALA